MSGTTMMPFGKHRGVRLSELPGGYLDWLGAKLNEWREPFRSALAAELLRRKGPTLPNVVNGPAPEPTRGSAHRPEVVGPPTGCHICELPGTTQRPLVHASCAQDEVPF
jgi:hypothetical protein